jgi:hypothetical protein
MIRWHEIGLRQKRNKGIDVSRLILKKTGVFKVVLFMFQEG